MFLEHMSDHYMPRLSLDGQSCVEPSCTSPARHRCKHCHKVYCNMCVRVHKRYVFQEMSDIVKQVYTCNYNQWFYIVALLCLICSDGYESSRKSSRSEFFY